MNAREIDAELARACSKTVICRWRAGVPPSETHLHELKRGAVFAIGGREGKLLRKGVGSCTVAYFRVSRRYNVATGRYRTQKRDLGPPIEIAPCATVDEGMAERRRQT